MRKMRMKMRREMRRNMRRELREYIRRGVYQDGDPDGDGYEWVAVPGVAKVQRRVVFPGAVTPQLEGYRIYVGI